MRLGYGRCSTDEQADALEAQILRLRQAGCQEIFSDLESGTNDDRPGLQQVMALVMAGQVTELFVTRVDRLGRHAAYADQLLALCSLKGVTVQAIDGGVIETATPQGFFMARTMTTLAEMESRMLSMRIKKQFAAYRQQGRHLRRRKPFGYMGGADHRLIPNPDEWDQALQVIEKLGATGSFSATAQHLPSWCQWTPAATNLQSWFCNPVIRGHIGHNRDKQSGKGWKQVWAEIHYDQHPALISDGDWQQLAVALRRTKNNFHGRVATDAQHGLTGLLTCLTCGYRMRRNSSAGVYWWRCRHRLCSARGGIKEQVVMPLAAQACVNAAQQLAIVAAAPPDEDPRVAVKRQDLEQLQALADRNPALQPSCQALEQEIEALRRRPQPLLDFSHYEHLMSDPQFFTGATAEEQRAIYGAVLKELRVGPGGAPVLPVLRSF